ncbi:MAG TPA: methyltransferase domain-containing protein, partial [Bryobacterales bacterium]|nr:methyltransferase domain-containing protein [Bryobacterales bacterium]
MQSIESTLCCPVCHGPVDRTPDGYFCAACGRLYPAVLGIPDFRVTLPEHFDQVKDLEMARALAEAEKDLDFDGLLKLCIRLTPKASDLQEKHLAHLAGEADQARTALDLMDKRRPLEPADAILEVGCGLGQYLAIAAERVNRVAGVDLCLRYLVLARKRLNGRGVVLAAEAERLPFRDGSFAGVIAA